jgi:N-acyl homoserine lactone hydrolase
LHIIRPMPTAKLKLEKSLMTYRLNFGAVSTLYSTIWLIEGQRENILVDAGCDAAFAARLGYQAETITDPRNALKQRGLSPDDIDILILTHMHFDHIGYISYFTNARILVQRKEYEFAMNPHPFFAGGYPREVYGHLKNYELIAGDAEITEGLRLLHTPGHTPGGQSVEIATEKGQAIICGLCTIVENFQPPEETNFPFAVIPPGSHTNVMEAYDSLLRIQKRADIAIPLHDPVFCQRNKIP